MILLHIKKNALIFDPWWGLSVADLKGENSGMDTGS